MSKTRLSLSASDHRIRTYKPTNVLYDGRALPLLPPTAPLLRFGNIFYDCPQPSIALAHRFEASYFLT